MHDSAFCEFTGGFASNLNLYGSSSGAVHQALIDSVVTRNDSKLTIYGIRTKYIRAAGNSRLEVYGTTASGNPEAQAGDAATLLLHGGTFGRVYTWWEGGRIELNGNPTAGEITAHSGGIVRQGGGAVDSLSCAASGVAILDKGTVNSFMTASNDSTLVLAGGVPPQNNIRLFNNARAIVFHDSASVNGMMVKAKRLSLKLADFNGTGYNSNFAGLRGFYMMDGYGQPVDFSAWNIQGEEWSGTLDLIRVDEGLTLEMLPDSDIALLAFRSVGAEVVQLEVSDDLKSWSALGSAIMDGEIHTEIVRIGSNNSRYFRLRKWQIP